jgi:hypothetical protein
MPVKLNKLGEATEGWYNNFSLHFAPQTLKQRER